MRSEHSMQLTIKPRQVDSRPMTLPSRDELASRYLDQLPFEPYKVQEDALLAWFTSDQGVLVCAATGMGKTLIAEAALFEALHMRPTGLLHHAADRPDGTEVPRDARPRRPVGIPGNRRRPGDRQSPRKPRGPGARGRGGNPAQSPPARRVRFPAHGGGRHGRVPQLQRSGTRHRLGIDPGIAAAARASALALGHGGQRHGLHPLAAAKPPADPRTGPRRRTPRAAELPLDRRQRC